MNTMICILITAWPFFYNIHIYIFIKKKSPTFTSRGSPIYKFKVFIISKVLPPEKRLFNKKYDKYLFYRFGPSDIR